ncbi:DUF3231 family protein [Virgibacillus salinus]|uniref:DUF3231 family protein n=1 Tax=Virgibacillus salinus TaxID=553311 RepID=A0A1H0Y1V4_9BACI|nr:DUF3231 family protein [Virgibacillus salinus]SDQ09142.1 Protein of unknown function [Virgibacillus salinus]
MNKEKLKLTSSEIGSLWGQYMNGTMTDIINRYMLSIIEDKAIKAIFQGAINTFAKQKKQLVFFIENEGFPVPIGFNESDLNKGTKRLFSDIFCLNYLHIMTIHGLVGHTTSFGIAVREDLRYFYDSCDTDGKKMYHQTIDLLLKKGDFQRDPYCYPGESPEFITTKDFTDGFFGKGRRLASTEIIGMSLNIKKSILAKTLCVAFSQVAKSKDVRKFMTDSQKIAEANIKSFSKILDEENLSVPKSWETEVTTSTESPFSDKLLMYHIGFLSQVAQGYYGKGLASAMRTDILTAYERVILRNLRVTQKWYKIMVENKWLEQQPLVPNRQELSREK